MKVILTMILGISLFPTVSIAHDDQALWVAKCRFGKYLVSIEAKSKSGDPSEDDMSNTAPSLHKRH